MWTQGRLASEAGVSPTTVSGIENGRISRPHFGTVEKLAGALGVDPRELISSGASVDEGDSRPSGTRLSLAWAMSSREDEFEDGLEEATLGGLLALSRKLEEEQDRLHGLYGKESDTGRRRLIKARIRGVAAQRGSVDASIAHHPDLAASPEG